MEQSHTPTERGALAVHEVLITQFPLKYIGGEEAQEEEEQEDLETQGEGEEKKEKKEKKKKGVDLDTRTWSVDGFYTFKYKTREPWKNGEYLLKIIPFDNTLVVNLMPVQNPDEVKTLEIDWTQYVDSHNPGAPFKDLDKLSTLLRKEFFSNQPSPSTSSRGNEGKDNRQSNTGDSEGDSNDPLRDNRRTNYSDHSRYNNQNWVDPLNIGRSDLDPFAPPGSGMFAGPNHPIFGRGPNYPHPNPTPPFGVPPNARYDPIVPGGIPPPGHPSNPHFPPNRPPNRNRFPGEPDPDEFAPPGFEDEFYS